MLIAARDDEGQSMTDHQLRDEVITLLLAGHETTALALSWTWYLLAQHPAADATLAAELRNVLGGRAPAVSDVPKLRFTEQVVTEAIRLYPPAWGFGREAIADCEIGGYAVPAGTTVIISPWVLHRDPRHFERPAEFHPERWSGELARQLGAVSLGHFSAVHRQPAQAPRTSCIFVAEVFFVTTCNRQHLCCNLWQQGFEFPTWPQPQGRRRWAPLRGRNCGGVRTNKKSLPRVTAPLGRHSCDKLR
jgi:Cytochrome P450